MKNLDNQIAAIVVTYKPDLRHLTKLLTSLREHAQWLIIVDNGATTDIVSLLDDNDIFISLNENLGLAAAQNIGIERALTLGAEFIYLSDQDSLPHPDMMKTLELAHRNNHARTPPVAAVGPITIDERTNTITSFWLVDRHGWPQQYQHVDSQETEVEVGFLIASGSLIARSAIQSVGGLKSSYFIDHIDTEWCLRCMRTKKFRLLGIPAAKLQHRMGDKVRRAWFLRWRQVVTHSPLRDYYRFRNTIQLLRDNSMSNGWRIYFLWQLLKFATYFLTIGEWRWKRAHLMSLGLWHGLRDIGGRLDVLSGKCASIPMNSLDPNSRSYKQKYSHD
jgi:rhamnosyltransferase